MKWSWHLLALVIMALGFEAAHAGAKTLIVGSDNAPFRSLRDAIVQAKPGDTIQVRPGTYEGALVLNKPLVLKGVGKPVIRGTGQGSVLVVLADKCVIEGFVIEHCGDFLEREDSGILLKSNGNRVEDNEFRDILFGVYFYHSSSNTVRRNVIHGRPELEVGERGAGLHLWTSGENLLEDNTISATRDGMYIQNSDGNVIRRNRVTDLRYGLHYMWSDNNTFEDNVFSNNVAGAAVMYSKHIQFRRNAFIHNRGVSSFGILFQECKDCLAEDNLIIDNGTGIFMEALYHTAFRNNVIAENDVALQIFSSSEENVFACNTFAGNLSPLLLVGKATTTRWQENGRGNYWSDYEGYDLDGDGIGDKPHKIQNLFQYMEGNYPRLRLYFNSPAAQALVMAEKTFPLIEGSQDLDKAPLMKPAPQRYSIAPSGRKEPIQAYLAAISLAMLALALAVIWRGQLR